MALTLINVTVLKILFPSKAVICDMRLLLTYLFPSKIKSYYGL